MLIHNKRLHPRRSCDHNGHHHGCLLHGMDSSTTDSRQSISSMNENVTVLAPISRSMGRQRNMSSPSSLSVSFASPEVTPQPIKRRSESTLSTSKHRNSIGAYPTSYDKFSVLFGDTVDTANNTQLDKTSERNSYKDRLKSKSTTCLSSTVAHSNEMRNINKRECYDSPDQIIANLFPGINDRETTFLRKGHGAVQMLKNKTDQKSWSNTVRSKSATGNYAMPNASQKLRSTGPHINELVGSNKNRYRSHSYATGGQLITNVDRDFMNLRWVNHECYITAMPLL